MGLAATNLVGVIIAIFVGIGLVNKEIERRTVYTIMARPISRTQFILGKYCGRVLTLLINVIIMIAAFLATLLMSGGAVHLALFQAIELIFVELLVVTALALFFSTFSSSTVSAIMTLGVYVIGHVTTDLRALAEKSHSETMKSVMMGLYYVCPNLEALNIKGQAASGTAVAMSYQAAVTAYGLLYAALLLTTACLVFQRRDF